MAPAMPGKTSKKKIIKISRENLKGLDKYIFKTHFRMVSFNWKSEFQKQQNLNKPLTKHEK